MAETPKKPRPARRRARKPDGKFQGDNPATPANEAWEPIPVEDALPKEKYAPAPKVSGISKNTAGKYSKPPKVKRVGIGKAHTKYN
jgi:hypothetical protein